MVTYRQATYEDNGELIRLTASTGMQGETALRIDRNPDFFSLLNLRGKSTVFVALADNKIIGSLCVSHQQVFIGEERYPLYYIGDFKVDAAYRNQGIGMSLCNALATELIREDADLAFLNVSKGNSKPFSFFHGRQGIPDFQQIGTFNIHQFIGKKKAHTHPAYKIMPIEITEELISFLQNHYRRYELGPQICKQNLAACECFVVREKGKIIAAMCLSDTMQVKQNVVLHLSPVKKVMVGMINAIHSIAGISKMPALHQPVKMLYIRYLAVENQGKIVVKGMVNYARKLVFERAYSFVSIGLHEKDPLQESFSGMFKITFNSVGMLVSMKNNRFLIDKVMQGIPFEDYSLV